ncbi:MAG: HAD family hydrolase [Candidatus Paceibacterota bacterium]|jgi:FMN phosphatase YigB (HAD superfamily)
MNIKAIIFDWGRTLYDVDTKKEISDAEDVLSYCKQKGYKICVASLVRANTTIEERENQIKALPLGKYIDMFEVSGEKEKDSILEKLIKKLNLKKGEILFVDDRIVKSIKYGNINDHPTAWLKSGPFANELPNMETGTPTFIIETLSELKTLI